MNYSELFRIGYHNWFLVTMYCVVVAVFLYGILRPTRKVEWVSAGIAQAWVIALYAEMYGLPLTMYAFAILMGRNDLPQQHFLGHFWPILFGWQDPIWLVVFDVVGQFFIVLGTIIALVGWRQLYQARKGNTIATTGLYSRIRHPQYLGFFLFLLGSIVNWPTIPTLLMFPALCWVYWRLAKNEEQQSIQMFPNEYREYMKTTGMFFPRWRQ